MWNAAFINASSFAAANHNNYHKQRTLKHRNTQDGSISSNHKSQTMTFWTRWSKFLFPKRSAKMMSFWRRVSSLNLAKTSLQWPPLHNGHFLMPPRCIPKFKDPIEWLGPVKTLNLMREEGLKRRLFSHGCVFLAKSNPDFRIQKLTLG